MKKTLIADSSLLFVAFIWGATFVLVQNAISILDPFSFNGVRFGLASILLFLWILLFHKGLFKKLDMKLFSSGIILGTWLFSAYALQTFGLLYTTSSKSGFITGLSVILVPIFCLIFFKQILKPFATVGVITATVGLYLLTLGDGLSINFGDTLTFFCAIAFAAHILLTSKYTSHYSTLLLTVIQITTVSVLSGISAFFFEDWKQAFSWEILSTFEVMFALFITAIFATVLAFLAQTNFQKYTTPTRVALIFAMEPVFAAITAYFWAHERLGPKALVGCLFIFIGMILAELPSKSIFSFKKAREKAS